MKIVPPMYVALMIVFMWITDRFLPVLEFEYDMLPNVGIAMFLLSVALFVWTVFIFKNHKTSIFPHDKPSNLITSGPFSVSRNPIYVAFTLALVGIALTFGSLTPLVFPFVFLFIMNTKFIPMEERNLEKVLGKDYLDYKSKVRRWL